MGIKITDVSDKFGMSIGDGYATLVEYEVDEEGESYGRICAFTGLYCTVECNAMYAPGGTVGPCPHPLKGKGDFEVDEP